MILGISGNRHKEQIQEVLTAFLQWLDEHGVEVVVSGEFEQIPGLDGRRFVPPDKVGDHADVVLSFGGDGTLLNTVGRLSGRETPVLGVNLGGLGYLTEVGSNELFKRTQQLLDGNWSIERRMILEVHTVDGDDSGPWYALNDVVIDKADYGRLIQIRASIDETYLNTFRADGIIIATPTGSTGYSLSAGGPILEPSMDGILLTPLNPHSLSNRPLVINDDKRIQVETFTPAKHYQLTVDGQSVTRLHSGAEVIIQRASFDACLVNFAGRYFYDVLRQKLGWGDIQIGHS